MGYPCGLGNHAGIGRAEPKGEIKSMQNVLIVWMDKWLADGFTAQPSGLGEGSATPVPEYGLPLETRGRERKWLISGGRAPASSRFNLFCSHGEHDHIGLSCLVGDRCRDVDLSANREESLTCRGPGLDMVP
ncbi:hypothetical protein GCM10009525_70080 [Streptosporangium amethystogenes subsp. fukuiense]